MRRGIAFAGFLLGAASAGGIAFAMQAAPDDDPRHAAIAVAVHTGRPADAQPEQTGRWLATSLARPLFAPDRRPIGVLARAGPDATALPRLSGIMIAPDGSRAIFGAAGGGKPVVVAEGGSVGGYVVQSISFAEVVLMGPDGRHSLHPTFDQAMPVVASQAPTQAASP